MWAARGLRYGWLGYAEPGVVAALADPSWRVRETVAKVVGQRRLVSAADFLLRLIDDDEPRVRVAIDGALRGLRLWAA